MIASSLMMLVGLLLVRTSLLTIAKLDIMVSDTALNWREELNLRICGNLAAADANLRASSALLSRATGANRYNFLAVARKISEQIFAHYPPTLTPTQQGRCQPARHIGLTTTLHQEDQSASMTKSNWISQFRVTHPATED